MGPKIIGALLLALLLAGCGESSGSNGTTETRDDAYYVPPTLPSDD